ncbi:Ras family protein, putative [Ichthyophthirius multifiliis]|uniref:Ras family protein, putative n=1 Tax=Ichthyophthirius multifiliis TaxID=5932 RepID=G0R5F5_ICHMU|nr:Ras family protein, putative [Ichthyophthirius multifiliis]EGR27313.1 Ras family protein, putative [Ichthyophthirius multifiliis]|eukprot:XP_004024197.1 Ras family protein, putative [Ichthyophthirius multifiliis]
MHTNESSQMTSNLSSASRVKHKIIFLGDQHVGKTCIIERFMYDVFDEKSHPTVGVDFLAKTLHVDDKTIRLQLWDTAGQERFRSLIPSYLRDATCAVIVFDVTNKESFSNTERWIKDYKDNRGAEAPCILVANKIDQKLQREISQEDGEKKAKSFEMNYYEISAKTGENVVNMFKSMALQLNPSDNIVSPTKQVNTKYKAK